MCGLEHRIANSYENFVLRQWNKNQKVKTEKEILMTKTPRERVILNSNGKDKIIVTVKRDAGDAGKKRHIIISVPSHMRWRTIWKILKKLPEHLENERKQKNATSKRKQKARKKVKA